MLDLAKKTILASLGVLSLTKEKAEKITKELVKRGEVAKTEEAKFVKDLMERAEKGRVDVEKKIEKAVKKTLVKLEIPTRKEMKELRTKIDKLSKNR